jgi:hypothetical protein
VKVPVPAVYATFNKQVMVTPERAEWTQVLCIDNSSPAKIQEVKRALNKRGASPQLRVDGQLDEQLTNSVRSFQRKSGLNATGLMTADTLDKLGVALR